MWRCGLHEFMHALQPEIQPHSRFLVGRQIQPMRPLRPLSVHLLKIPPKKKKNKGKWSGWVDSCSCASVCETQSHGPSDIYLVVSGLGQTRSVPQPSGCIAASIVRLSAGPNNTKIRSISPVEHSMRDSIRRFPTKNNKQPSRWIDPPTVTVIVNRPYRNTNTATRRADRAKSLGVRNHAARCKNPTSA
jgi:hypothetical protein